MLLRYLYCAVKNNPIPLRASSIVVCRPYQILTSFFDYQVLFLKRNENMSFGNSLVFPGGRYQAFDEDLRTSTKTQTADQACGFRQTFEQTGLYFTNKEILTMDQLNLLEQLRARSLMQIMTNRLDFTAIYKELCISQMLTQDPNLVSFIRLVTIPFLAHRYDTRFYLKMLSQRKYVSLTGLLEKGMEGIHNSDCLYIQNKEHSGYQWMTPSLVLERFFKKQIKLNPPQFIILNVMSSFTKFADLQAFLTNLKNQLDYPQVISLVANKELATKQKYPYAATLMGDYEFPFERLANTEKSEDLKREILACQQKVKEKGLNRFLFSQPKHFFESEFEIQCSLNKSLLNRMLPTVPLKHRISAIV